MSDIKEKVVNAFKNRETGLTKSPALLKKKNEELRGIHDAAIREILNNEVKTYNKNGPVKRVKKFVKYKANYFGQIIHADLMFLNSARNTNQSIEIDNKKYVLVLVDTLSKYIWIYPIETKSSEKVAELIIKTVEKIIEKYYNGDDSVIFKILTDAGKEFKTSFIEKHPQIKHIISKNPRGAALSEAAILRIRTKLKYLDKNIRTLSEEELNQIVRNLNSENDSLKIVNKEIIPEVEVVENENLKFVLKQGDYVRVKVEKQIFEKKSSLENFSEKILIVLDSQIDTRNQVVRYVLGSMDGEFISEKLWYEEELKKIPVSFLKTEDLDKHKEFTKEEIKNFYLVK